MCSGTVGDLCEIYLSKGVAWPWELLLNEVYKFPLWVLKLLRWSLWARDEIHISPKWYVLILPSFPRFFFSCNWHLFQFCNIWVIVLGSSVNTHNFVPPQHAIVVIAAEECIALLPEPLSPGGASCNSGILSPTTGSRAGRLVFGHPIRGTLKQGKAGGQHIGIRLATCTYPPPIM